MLSNLTDLEIERSAALFEKYGVVVLHELLQDGLGDRLRSIVDQTLEIRGARRDFLMPQTADSPRRMTVVNGHVTTNLRLIRSIYEADTTLRVLSKIARERVSLCPDRVEDVIITELNELGDTHGWHLDDYPLALILIIEAPKGRHGGDVEYINASGDTVVLRLLQDDAYLMRTDQRMHRVSPLESGAGCRRIINLTYSIYDQRIEPNGSAQLLLSQPD